jgi:hypothetical protein
MSEKIFPSGLDNVGGRVYTDTTKQDTTTKGKIVTEIQLMLMRQALKIEIKTWDTSRMTLTREPALSVVKRLTGEDFGRGLRARQDALAWLNEIAVANGIEIDE